MRNRIALILYVILGLGSVLFGGFYALRTEVMPFHLAVIGQDWASIPEGSQVILMVLLKEMGVGQIVLGLSVLLIALGPYRQGDAWARRAAPLIGLIGMALTTVFAYEVVLKTGLASPWPASALATIAYGLAYLVSEDRAAS